MFAKSALIFHMAPNWAQFSRSLSLFQLEITISDFINCLQILTFLSRVHYRQADFTDEKFNPPAADIYFFYRPNQDYKQNQIAISKLENISKMKSFKILAVDLSEAQFITDKFISPINSNG